MRQCPAWTHKAILHPNVIVLIRKLIVHDSILRKDAGMRFTVVMHDVALVVDEILDSQRRGYHLA